MTCASSKTGSAVLALLLLAAPTGALAAEGRVRFLTPPAQGDPAQIALDYLRQLAVGLRDDERPRWSVRDRHVSQPSGVTHLYLRQELGGIEVYGGSVALAVTPEGRLVSLRPGSVAPERVRARPRTPVLSASEAVHQYRPDSGWRAPAQSGHGLVAV